MDNKDIDNYTNEKNIEESQITLDKQADKNIEKTITIKSIKDVAKKNEMGKISFSYGFCCLFLCLN